MQFQVWSHLLGVGVNTGKSLAKINTFPAVPMMYSQLLTKADELFKDKKTRDYVKTTCAKRIRWVYLLYIHELFIKYVPNTLSLTFTHTQVNDVQHGDPPPTNRYSVEKCYR